MALGYFFAVSLTYILQRLRFLTTSPCQGASCNITLFQALRWGWLLACLCPPSLDLCLARLKLAVKSIDHFQYRLNLNRLQYMREGTDLWTRPMAYIERVIHAAGNTSICLPSVSSTKIPASAKLLTTDGIVSTKWAIRSRGCNHLCLAAQLDGLFRMQVFWRPSNFCCRGFSILQFDTPPMDVECRLGPALALSSVRLRQPDQALCSNEVR